MSCSDYKNLNEAKCKFLYHVVTPAGYASFAKIAEAEAIC